MGYYCAAVLSPTRKAGQLADIDQPRAGLAHLPRQRILPVRPQILDQGDQQILVFRNPADASEGCDHVDPRPGAVLDVATEVSVPPVLKRPRYRRDGLQGDGEEQYPSDEAALVYLSFIWLGTLRGTYSVLQAPSLGGHYNHDILTNRHAKQYDDVYPIRSDSSLCFAGHRLRRTQAVDADTEPLY